MQIFKVTVFAKFGATRMNTHNKIGRLRVKCVSTVLKFFKEVNPLINYGEPGLFCDTISTLMMELLQSKIAEFFYDISLLDLVINYY